MDILPYEFPVKAEAEIGERRNVGNCIGDDVEDVYGCARERCLDGYRRPRRGNIRSIRPSTIEGFGRIITLKARPSERYETAFDDSEPMQKAVLSHQVPVSQFLKLAGMLQK